MRLGELLKIEDAALTREALVSVRPFHSMRRRLTTRFVARRTHHPALDLVHGPHVRSLLLRHPMSGPERPAPSPGEVGRSLSGSLLEESLRGLDRRIEHERAELHLRALRRTPDLRHLGWVLDVDADVREPTHLFSR